MASYIVLEGAALYIFIAIILAMTLALCVLCWSGIYQDQRIEILQAQLEDEKEKVAALNHANFRLKLKYGALNPEKER